MKTASKYWNLVRLDSSGKVKITEIVPAKGFFKEQVSNYSDREGISDLAVQKDLVTIKNSDGKNSTLANQCLRCFISHQIRQACIQLDMQFGREHGFSRHDLFIYTLNDTLDNFRDTAISKRTSNKRASQYQSLAVEILETFDPAKANLATWTNRYIKQNRELQRFLLEQGVYLISNWAILNDTNTKQVQRILAEFHNLTPEEIKQASILLSGYHNVYRSDRLKNRQTKGGKCATPTTEQLERIADAIAQQNLILSPEQTLTQLEKLAGWLREYRIHVRGGKMKQESFDNTEINTEGMQASVVQEEEEPADRGDFLKSYQQQFQASLDNSIEAVITTRLSKFKGKKAAKAPQFITALELFHCQGESMGAIAPKVGLKAQYQVTRLLKLKELRIDIRHQMLVLMKDWTMEQSKLEDLASLKQRESEIELALGEQIDLVLDEAEKEASVADSTESILAKKICAYLDQLF